MKHLIEPTFALEYVPPIDNASRVVKLSNSRDIVLASSRLLQNFWRDRAGEADDLPLPGMIHSLDDIDRCVETLEDALRRPVLYRRVEDDLNLLLGYLMVASVRGRQLAHHR